MGGGESMVSYWVGLKLHLHLWLRKVLLTQQLLGVLAGGFLLGCKKPLACE